MCLRVRQFACLLLLLSSLGAAETASRHASGALANSHYLAVLLQPFQTRAAGHSPMGIRKNAPAVNAPLERAEAVARRPWNMRAPAAHTATVHTFTGLAA